MLQQNFFYNKFLKTWVGDFTGAYLDLAKAFERVHHILYNKLS